MIWYNTVGFLEQMISNIWIRYINELALFWMQKSYLAWKIPCQNSCHLSIKRQQYFFRPGLNFCHFPTKYIRISCCPDLKNSFILIQPGQQATSNVIKFNLLSLSIDLVPLNAEKIVAYIFIIFYVNASFWTKTHLIDQSLSLFSGSSFLLFRFARGEKSVFFSVFGNARANERIFSARSKNFFFESRKTFSHSDRYRSAKFHLLSENVRRRKPKMP